MPVPCNWETKGVDIPIYTNIQYPFDAPKGPPSMPRHIPTGMYRKWFHIPKEWLDKIYTQQNQLHVIFHGVESAFHVWCNGKLVGYNQDSRLKAEYNLTPFLKPESRNLLAVRVLRWSDGSYLEDQVL